MKRALHMDQIFRFPNAVRRDPAIDEFLDREAGTLREIARYWFDVMRDCGEDVLELIHDGHPTACVEQAAFAYVNAYKAHVNVGFFRGAELADPSKLLEGTGKLMRHVKLRPDKEVDTEALHQLIDVAYLDMKSRLTAN